MPAPAFIVPAVGEVEAPPPPPAPQKPGELQPLTPPGPVDPEFKFPLAPPVPVPPPPLPGRAVAEPKTVWFPSLPAGALLQFNASLAPPSPIVTVREPDKFAVAEITSPPPPPAPHQTEHSPRLLAPPPPTTKYVTEYEPDGSDHVPVPEVKTTMHVEAV